MPAQKSFIPSPALIRNLGCLIKLIAGFTVLICLGYFALVALNPKARQWATKGAKDGSGGPTPFKALNQVLAIPAQAMGKTDDVVKANNARVGQLDGLVAEEEAKTKSGSSGSSRPVVDPFASPATTTGHQDGADASRQAISGAALLALAEKNAAANSGSQTSDPTPQTSPPPRPAPQAPAPDSPDQM
ncbi:MAG TPA: hypothetical protein PLQ52_04240, partial [Lacunisphaera sp.]|nr:hypothetical protein [Lacunisphaera sp.]